MEFGPIVSCFAGPLLVLMADLSVGQFYCHECSKNFSSSSTVSFSGDV